VKRALAVVSSHYLGVDLLAISKGYIIDNDEKSKKEVLKLAEAVDAPSNALATLIE
jgi:hypothetical protein